MIEKRTAISQIELTPNRVVQIRFDKQVVDGDNVLASAYHRTVIEPGIDPDAQLDFVNVHLAQMGWPAITKADRERIKAVVGFEHTPDVISAYHRDA